jgi:hypothetical protein
VFFPRTLFKQKIGVVLIIVVGGPYRECLMQVVSDTQGKDSTVQLFIPAASTDSQYYLPNPSKTSAQSLLLYEFVGQLLGMCFRTGDSMPFSPIIWKSLVGEPVTEQDYEQVCKSIQQAKQSKQAKQKLNF